MFTTELIGWLLANSVASLREGNSFAATAALPLIQKYTLYIYWLTWMKYC